MRDGLRFASQAIPSIKTLKFHMRVLVFAILSIFTLTIFAQKQMTIRNSETGEEMTITVPDGLVITSGYENDEGDMVVYDTIYADSDESFGDAIACDTMYVDELQSGDNTFALAQQYRTEGKYFEAVLALYQSWLMGKHDEVDSFIGSHEDVQKALTFVMFWDDEPQADIKSKLDMLEELRIDNDKEICVFLDLLKIRYNGMNEKAALKELWTTLSKKYRDNPFFLYLNAIIEYNEDGELKDVVHSFEDLKTLAERGVAFAYADVARSYANGSGTSKDCEKAIEYFKKTIDSGLLVQHDAQEFIYCLNDSSNEFVSEELRIHLMRTVSIDLTYWLKIQKRINNIKTL